MFSILNDDHVEAILAFVETGAVRKVAQVSRAFRSALKNDELWRGRFEGDCYIRSEWSCYEKQAMVAEWKNCGVSTWLEKCKREHKCWPKTVETRPFLDEDVLLEHHDSVYALAARGEMIAFGAAEGLVGLIKQCREEPGCVRTTCTGGGHAADTVAGVTWASESQFLSAGRQPTGQARNSPSYSFCPQAGISVCVFGTPLESWQPSGAMSTKRESCAWRPMP